MDYDFSKLNDREFEALGASVIEKILNTRVETFKAGRDGGVDGRFWISSNKEGIIQCKQYAGTPYTTLISKLKSEEAEKVTKLKPERYIFVTSQKLSRPNKQEIKSIFHPFIKRQDDIFGYENLNAFLLKKENQDIVEQNFKLWITSASVLDLIYNNAIKGRSESTIRELQEKAYKYVITENHSKGLKILEENNVVILTGEPGIGKTTLADNLALYYTAKGYEFCDIEENISEAENIYREKENKKILFYCDDFLGSNLYDAINNKRDSHIVKFINRIHKDKSKKFILTSRTSILNKAFSLSHIFQNKNIRENEFLLQVKNLTDLDKAHILYNHIYHSNLDKDYIDEIYKNKRYREIIRHRNFNPRIIEFITDNRKVGDISAINYWKYIIKSLDEPQYIWTNYFQNQIDDCVRALTYLTVFNNGRISEETLRRAYNIFLKIHPINFGDNSDKSFDAVRKLGSKSLLNRIQIEENEFEYVLFNPSITDFVLSTYASDNDLISNILKSLETETSLEFLATLFRNKKITEATSKVIQENLFEHFLEIQIKNKNWDFLILLSYHDFFNEKIIDKIKQLIEAIIIADSPNGNRLYELLIVLRESEHRLKITNYSFLNGFINNDIDEDILKHLLNFIDEFNIDDEDILYQVDYLLTSFFENFAKYDLYIDYNNHMQHSYSPEGDAEIEMNMSAIESEVHTSLEANLSDFNKNVVDLIEFDVSKIVSALNLETRATEFLESYEPYDDERISSYRGFESGLDNIDYIFER